MVFVCRAVDTWGLHGASTSGSSAEPTATWQFVGSTDATVDETAVTSLLGTSTQLNADELSARPPSQTGLNRPHVQVILTLRDGRTERLALGQAVGQESGGYYASRGEGAEIFIVPAIIQKTLTDAMAKLKPGGASTTKAPARP